MGTELLPYLLEVKFGRFYGQSCVDVEGARGNQTVLWSPSAFVHGLDGMFVFSSCMQGVREIRCRRQRRLHQHKHSAAFRL